MRAKLTKRFVEAAPKPATEKNDLFLWDSEVKGFGCRVTAKGGRIYLVQSRINGRLRRFRLGPHGAITVEQARTLAKSMLADIAAGGDPISVIRAERLAGKDAPSVRQLGDRYLTEHARVHKKPRSVHQDEKNLELHIYPAIGSFRVVDVTREDIAKLHHRLRTTPFGANRVLALLSKMFNLAERWGLRPDASNPCRHVVRYKESKRERYLSELELARLGKALREAEATCAESPAVIAAIRLLLLTGARLGEIRTLRWEYVDLERGYLRLPDSKTGAKQIVLNGAAQAVLLEINRERSPWVIPGVHPARCLVNLEKPWRRIRKAAKIPDVRLHDLRHTFASCAAGQNHGLPIVGQLLGHRSPTTTARYAHLADDPLRRATEGVGEQIRSALSAEVPALTIAK